MLIALKTQHTTITLAKFLTFDYVVQRRKCDGIFLASHVSRKNYHLHQPVFKDVFQKTDDEYFLVF
jgi:hypothetical protein